MTLFETLSFIIYAYARLPVPAAYTPATPASMAPNKTVRRRRNPAAATYHKHITPLSLKLTPYA